MHCILDFITKTVSCVSKLTLKTYFKCYKCILTCYEQTLKKVALLLNQILVSYEFKYSSFIEKKIKFMFLISCKKWVFFHTLLLLQI